MPPKYCQFTPAMDIILLKKYSDLHPFTLGGKETTAAWCLIMAEVKQHLGDGPQSTEGACRDRVSHLLAVQCNRHSTFSDKITDGPSTSKRLKTSVENISDYITYIKEKNEQNVLLKEQELQLAGNDHNENNVI